jgi:hypothetical protein
VEQATGGDSGVGVSIASPPCYLRKQVTTNIATFYSTSVFNFTIINIP